MPNLTKDHAEKCVAKIKKRPKDERLPRLEIRVVSTHHTYHQLWYGTQLIGKIGINHGSNRNAGHGHIADDLELSAGDVLKFAVCTMSVDEMIRHFIDKQMLVLDPEDRPDATEDEAQHKEDVPPA